MNLIEVIEKNAANTPDKTGLCDLQTSYTFWKMLDESKQMAARFQSLGIQKGDAVALMGQNSFDWIFAYFGLLLCGAVVVPVNHKLTARETSFILEDCSARLFLFDGALAEVAKGIELNIPKLAIDTKASGFESVRDQKSESFSPVPVTNEDTAQILYTSGTTGNPKGCIHTHAGVCAAGSTGQKAISLRETDRMLVAMPIWHSSPLNNWFAGITIAGGTTVILREYHPLHFLRIVQNRQCTVYFGAPISYLLPLQMIPNFGEFDLTSMRAWIYGGGPIAPETVKKLAATYKTDRFYQVYGMTESGPTGTVLLPEDHKEHAGSIGCQALPGAELKVVKEDGSPADPEETGEIWLKAGSMMKSYLNRPDATADAFSDGWYRTGDMARIDADGYLFIVDRIKDMIVTGGENVYSKEVEDMIMEHPDVAGAAVVGSPHPEWGETVNAFLVPAKDTELSEEVLKNFLAERLARYKIPKKFHFVTELPHTPSGKVMKYKLREEIN